MKFGAHSLLNYRMLKVIQRLGVILENVLKRENGSRDTQIFPNERQI